MTGSVENFTSNWDLGYCLRSYQCSLAGLLILLYAVACIQQFILMTFQVCTYQSPAFGCIQECCTL